MLIHYLILKLFLSLNSILSAKKDRIFIIPRFYLLSFMIFLNNKQELKVFLYKGDYFYFQDSKDLQNIVLKK